MAAEQFLACFKIIQKPDPSPPQCPPAIVPWTPGAISFFHYANVDVTPTLPEMPLSSLGNWRGRGAVLIGGLRPGWGWAGLRPTPNPHSLQFILIFLVMEYQPTTKISKVG